jgi:HK97 family phage prohead protease
MNQMLYKAAPIDKLIDADENAGIIKGYASIFGNKDSDNDIIIKGAYKKTLSENGERVKYLYQHDMALPIGKMQELYEDEKGLMFVAKIAQTQLGKDVIELMKAGIITENSVGILPLKGKEQSGYREITEVKLYEISAVTLAANDQAKILDVKGNVDVNKLSKRYDNLSKLLKKGNISDEMGFAIEAEVLKLKSLFIEFTKPVDKITLPNVEVKNNDSEVYKYLINSLKN